jgi:hypothetical protein
MGLSLMIGVVKVSPALGKERDPAKQASKMERMQLKQERKIEARHFKEQRKDLRRLEREDREDDKAFHRHGGMHMVSFGQRANFGQRRSALAHRQNAERQALHFQQLRERKLVRARGRNRRDLAFQQRQERRALHMQQHAERMAIRPHH